MLLNLHRAPELFFLDNFLYFNNLKYEAPKHRTFRWNPQTKTHSHRIVVQISSRQNQWTLVNWKTYIELFFFHKHITRISSFLAAFWSGSGITLASNISLVPTWQFWFLFSNQMADVEIKKTFKLKTDKLLELKVVP